MPNCREETAADRRGRPAVAIVNASFARTHFPGADALGKRFRKGRGIATNEWLTVVGIVPDMLMQGLGIGLILALLAAGPLQSILYKVQPRDPMVVATVLGALAAASLLASFIPAQRVTRIDPVVALTIE